MDSILTVQHLWRIKIQRNIFLSWKCYIVRNKSMLKRTIKGNTRQDGKKKWADTDFNHQKIKTRYCWITLSISYDQFCILLGWWWQMLLCSSGDILCWNHRNKPLFSSFEFCASGWYDRALPNSGFCLSNLISLSTKKFNYSFFF